MRINISCIQVHKYHAQLQNILIRSYNYMGIYSLLLKYITSEINVIVESVIFRQYNTIHDIFSY